MLEETSYYKIEKSLPIQETFLVSTKDNYIPLSYFRTVFVQLIENHSSGFCKNMVIDLSSLKVLDKAALKWLAESWNKQAAKVGLCNEIIVLPEDRHIKFFINKKFTDSILELKHEGKTISVYYAENREEALNRCRGLAAA